MLIVVAVFCRFYSIFQLAGKRYRLLRVCVCLADPGEARRCSVSEPFPPTALRRGHAQTVRDGTSSFKIDLSHSDQELSKSRRASIIN